MKPRLVLLLLLAMTPLGFAESDADAAVYRQHLKRASGDSRAVNPALDVVIPRIANGVVGDLRFQTTLVISNTTGSRISATIRFYSGAGEAMSMDVFDASSGSLVGQGSVITANVEPFGSSFLVTDGVGDVRDGSAIISASGPIGANASFALTDRTSDTPLTTVGVGGSAPTPAFSIPLYRDDAAGSNTVLALSNVTSSVVRLELFAFSNDGRSGRRTLTIGRHESFAAFIDELFNVEPRFFGTLNAIRVDAAGNAVPLFDVAPLALFVSKGLLTSLSATNLIPF